jgi:hypothetical protein
MALIKIGKDKYDEEMLFRVQDFISIVQTLKPPIRIFAVTNTRKPPLKEDSRLASKSFDSLGHAYLYFRSVYPEGEKFLWIQDSEGQVAALWSKRWELAFQALMDSANRQKNVWFR